MLFNLRFLSALVVPNIPIYDRLSAISPELVSAIVAFSAVLAFAGHLLAIYLFWKGSALVRFALGLIYLPFLQYTLWHGGFAGASRYLYYPSAGFSILLALLIARFYRYLQVRAPQNALRVAAVVVAGILVFNLVTIQLWVQRNIANGQVRRPFVTQLAAELPHIDPESRVYIEVPEGKYLDLAASCYLVMERPPYCQAFVSGQHTLDTITADARDAPFYWWQVTSEGYVQLHPLTTAEG
jgi:hypothetical protein